MAADLHCHTRHSDGSATVEEVILFAKGNGVSTLAITDHDTVSGWEEAARYGERYGMTVIPGIELSGTITNGDKKPIFCVIFVLGRNGWRSFAARLQTIADRPPSK